MFVILIVSIDLDLDLILIVSIELVTHRDCYVTMQDTWQA